MSILHRLAKNNKRNLLLPLNARAQGAEFSTISPFGREISLPNDFDFLGGE
jgi:hypothetical protein